MKSLRQIDENLIQHFHVYLYEEEKSKNTIEKYMRDIECFRAFVGDRMITKQRVIEYKQWLLENDFSIASINSMIAATNCFLNYLGWEDCKVKMLKVQRKAFSNSDKELTTEEYRCLVNTAQKKGKERLALLLQTVCGTGIRISELPFITIEGVKENRIIVSLKGKFRQIFIIEALKAKLLHYAEKMGIVTGPIFITKSGKPMNRSNIWREMKKLCLDADVNPEKVYPHNLRHLFARCFYHVKKDIAKLADILGHNSIETTRIYIITTDREHRKQMEQLPLIL